MRLHVRVYVYVHVHMRVRVRVRVPLHVFSAWVWACACARACACVCVCVCVCGLREDNPPRLCRAILLGAEAQARPGTHIMRGRTERPPAWSPHPARGVIFIKENMARS